MKVEKVYFKAKDGLSLFGLLHKCNGGTKEIVLSIHGMQSNIFKERDRVESEYLTERNIDFFDFNNRGSEIYTKTNTIIDGKKVKINCGSMWENVYDCILDIDAAVDELISKGYEKIILQGHSLGSIKSVIYYNYLIENNLVDKLSKIRALILLSLVGIKEFLYYDDPKHAKHLEKLSNKLVKKGKFDTLTEGFFGFPMTAKCLNQYFQENLNFVQFLDKNFKFELLNKINCPLFMRYGTINEIIPKDAFEIIEILNSKTTNNFKDFGAIEGANHSFKNKELVLTEQIYDFIKKAVV